MESNSSGQSAVLIKRWSGVRISPFQPYASAAVGRRTVSTVYVSSSLTGSNKRSHRLTDKPFGYEPEIASSNLAVTANIVLWCKGSTGAFDAFSVRSSRTGTTNLIRRVTLAGRRVSLENC